MKRSAIAAGVLLAACSQQGADQSEASAEPSPSMPAPVATPAAPTPSPTVAAAVGKLPPVDGAQLCYVGRWAATEQLCASGAWRFSATHLETAGEVSCSFERVDTVPGGYDIHATCTAEAPPEPDVIKLRFAESAQALLVESKALKATGLIYCGALKR